MSINRRKVNIFLHRFFRKKENGFDHVISLGYNCEVTFRFLKYFNFEESSLFNWSYSYSVTDLINALKNLNDLGKDGFDLPNPLWMCRKTHIFFHGKENVQLYMDKKDTLQVRKKDHAELKSRIEYLKRKFIKIAQSKGSKLYIYKIKNTDIDFYVQEKLQQLYDALEQSIGAQNFKLLIVCEKTNIKVKSNPLYILRNVHSFAPDNDVTNKKYFNNGWDKIYHEFYPNHQPAPKYKRYKFES